MQCPADGTTLVMSERQGIEIDYCPKCRGVWLDRGELDKIIERSASAAAPQPQAAPPPAKQPVQQPWGGGQRPPEPHRGYEQPHHHGKPYRKKKSFLDDIFDF